MKTLKSRCGYAMISTMLAITVGAIMVGGTYAAATHARTMAIEDIAREELQTISSRAHDSYYIVTGSYYTLGAQGGDGVEQFQKLGAFPKEMIKSDGNREVITNPWKGKVDVFADLNMMRFWVAFDDVPKNSCQRLATTTGDWKEIRVGSANGALLNTVATALEHCQDNNRICFLLGTNY
jgi:hypothetical protein